MRIDFGRHNRKSVELVVLEDPGYVKWVLDQANPSRGLLLLKDEMLRLITIFDEKPILTRCTDPNCTNKATRASVYRGSVGPSWWCDSCSPSQQSAFEDRPRIITTYKEALTHVAYCCRGRKLDYEYLVYVLAQAKGLTSGVDEAQAQEFFCLIPLENRFLEQSLLPCF